MSTKTGLHRAPHARKPLVCSVVFNQDTGKMELERPKSTINQGIGIFEAYRSKLQASPFIDTPNGDKMKQVFGFSGVRDIKKTFKEQRRKAYNALPKSEAQIANQKRIREMAQRYKGGEQPPQLKRSAKANLLRNNYKAAESAAKRAQQKLERASKPKKQIIKKEYKKRTYPTEIANQMSRSSKQFSRNAVEEDDDELFM